MSPWRRTLYATWAGQLFSMIGFSFVFPFMPRYLSHLGVPEGNLELWSGMVTAATGLTMVVFAPVWGHFADRHGRKIMVLRSMFGGAIIIALTGFARNEWDVLILRTVQGMLTGTITASLALVSSVTPPERVGYSMGMMYAAVACGNSVGPLVGGVVVDHFGYRAAFMAGAALVGLGGALVSFFATEEFTRPPKREEGHLLPFRRMLATAGFVAALLTLFQISFANSAPQPIFQLFVEKLYGFGKGLNTVTGLIIASTGVAAAVGAAVMGHYADGWGHKRVLMACMLLGGILTLPVCLVESVGGLLVLRIAFGLLSAGVMPSANAIIRQVMDKEHLGKAYGMMASVTCLGWGLGPLVGGAMAKQWGLGAPFVLTGEVLLLTVLVVAWRIREVDVRGR